MMWAIKNSFLNRVQKYGEFSTNQLAAISLLLNELLTINYTNMEYDKSLEKHTPNYEKYLNDRCKAALINTLLDSSNIHSETYKEDISGHKIMILKKSIVTLRINDL